MGVYEVRVFDEDVQVLSVSLGFISGGFLLRLADNDVSLTVLRASRTGGCARREQRN